MTEQIPEDVGEAAEVEINFEPDDYGIRVVATLGDSCIIVQHAWDAAEEAATLVQTLPNIMMAVQQALDSQEEQT